MNYRQNPPRASRWASSRQNKRSRAGANDVSHSNSTPIYAGGKIVGYVEGDEFIKRLRASVHFLRKPSGIAFDMSSLLAAEQAGAIRVKVIELESGKIFRAPISLIYSQGFPFNRGFGNQQGLGLNHFTLGDDPLGEHLELWGPQDPEKPSVDFQENTPPTPQEKKEKVLK